MRSPFSYVEVCRGGRHDIEKTLSNDVEICRDDDSQKEPVLKYKLFITLPNNTKVMKSFYDDDEKVSLKTAIDDIIQALRVAKNNEEWMLHIKRPLPQRIIAIDSSEMNTSLLKIGKGMDISIMVSQKSSQIKPPKTVTSEKRGVTSTGIRRKAKKRSGKTMTLESSGHYAKGDKMKKKNNEYSTGGSTVMISGDEDEEEEDDDHDDENI